MMSAKDTKTSLSTTSAENVSESNLSLGILPDPTKSTISIELSQKNSSSEARDNGQNDNKKERVKGVGQSGVDPCNETVSPKSKTIYYAGGSKGDTDLNLFGLNDDADEKKSGDSDVVGHMTTPMNMTVGVKLKRTCTRICNGGYCGNKEEEHQQLFQVGNSIVLNSFIYQRFSLCIVGPTWVGCIFTIFILSFASYYFIKKAYEEVGLITTLICVGLSISTIVSFFFVSCCDPGIVMTGGSVVKGNRGYTETPQGEEEGWRYCDFCSLYQPPDAAHCSQCNVCVEGYDHHCPWMGTCIGKRNHKAFILFNFSWLFYLIYAFIWVSVLGPTLFKSSEKIIGSEDI